MGKESRDDLDRDVDFGSAGRSLDLRQGWSSHDSLGTEIVPPGRVRPGPRTRHHLSILAFGWSAQRRVPLYCRDMTIDVAGLIELIRRNLNVVGAQDIP